jgi:hypothetical protein
MMGLYRRKWRILAALSLGSVFQLASCREDAALLGLRTAFSSITLPINTLVRSFFQGLI